MQDPYRVKLESVFEGPMDLLVHLIKKNEVDIYDIPIATITDQFLAYVEWMKSMSIDFAGDFLVLAATLAQIKSRMLLPRHENEEEEDPRMEIARPLLEYLQMQSVADQLSRRPLLGEHTFARQPSQAEFVPPDQEAYIKVGLFELIDAFQGILKKAAVHHRVDMSSDRLSVKERITQIVDLLEEEGSLTFTDLFSTEIEKGDIVVTFLAILEMAKMCLVRIAQHSQTGIIRLFYV